jgi:integrase
VNGKRLPTKEKRGRFHYISLGTAIGLQWRDVNLDRQVVTVREVHAKSGLARNGPLNQATWNLLAKLRPEGAPPEAHVFLNRVGKPYVQISTLYRAAIAKAGVKNFRIRDLRHTFASRLVMRGVSLAAVRELLGHQDYAMTLRYAHR